MSNSDGNFKDSCGSEYSRYFAATEQRRDVITLNLDHKQMGVGGDDSWGARTHPEYTLDPKPYSYSFRLRPVVRDRD